MDAGRTKQRAFILSSFRRMDIILSTKVYRFADHLVDIGWMPPLASLTEVDKQILKKFQEFY